ncbi:DNA replication complex GINS family protein [Candidatus Pacearchaeota archaeon]|nr:DNA replication complex GINS family protein [Candidatus Pacearchaeota archaeon]
MLDYNTLYEILRKEKYSDALQQLPKNFLEEFSEYISGKKELTVKDDDLFTDTSIKAKKQLENSLALFRELILRRKKKILNLVFVAAETGIMKRDYENMLSFEKEIFDKLVKAFEEGDKEISKTLNGKKGLIDQEKNKLILFNQDIEKFVDMTGNIIGPFKSGELVNLDSSVSEILVQSGKANFVDE